MHLIDVVNFNADASCLWSKKWLACLKGSKGSVVYKMFQQYVKYKRKVNLGLTGATICDLAYFNPECVRLINENPDVFEMIIRPFSHDSPLLRTKYGFLMNVKEGIRVLKKHFKKINDFYLAPELMKTAQQVTALKNLGIKAVFVNKDRYEKEIARRIPDAPYLIKGVMASTLPCIPFNQREAYALYLDVIHGHKAPNLWAEMLKNKKANYYFWRDGESCLLVPFGVEYENKLFAAEEKAGIMRLFLSQTQVDTATAADGNGLHNFPYHTLRPWFKDMKLYWFTSRVRDIEAQLKKYGTDVARLWMLIINSDIMSSAEKSFPFINAGKEAFCVNCDEPSWLGVEAYPTEGKLKLLRSDRAIEGEDYLAYLDLLLEGKMSFKKILKLWQVSCQAHLLKGYARIVRK